MLSIEPRYDRVLVQCVEEDERKAFGLVVSHPTEEIPRQGTVVAVGSGRRLESGAVVPVDLKKGDRVLIGGGVGVEINLEGKTYLIVRENGILATLMSR